jgi:hypothetical protein
VVGHTIWMGTRNSSVLAFRAPRKFSISRSTTGASSTSASSPATTSASSSDGALLMLLTRSMISTGSAQITTWGG